MSQIAFNLRALCARDGDRMRREEERAHAENLGEGAGSAVVLQLCSELAAGGEDAALHSAHGEGELLSYLLILVAGHVHLERAAEVIGKMRDDFVDFAYGIGTVGILVGLKLRSVEVEEIFSGVGHRVLTHLAAIVVDEDVAHDCEKPSLEVDVLCELVFTVKSLERGVLHEVGCTVMVGCQLVGKTEEVALQSYYARDKRRIL